MLQSYHTAIKDLPFVLFVLGGFFILTIMFQQSNYISIRLEQEIIPQVISIFGFTTFTLDGIKLLSLLAVENTLLIVLLTSVTVKWMENKNKENIMYIGYILFGVGSAVIAFSNHIGWLFIAMFVLTIGELLFVPTRQTILADVVNDSKRGTYMAFNGFSMQIGKIIATLGIIVGEQIGGIGMSFTYIFLTILGIGFTKLAMSKYQKNKLTKSDSHNFKNVTHSKKVRVS
ncbi:MFS transporter [Chengkuizengella axinellae]|uniref:MFS transporter n=1 Tax=Chengkuizengella axinellae TaxID=3064388 RepID=A0ABT9J6F6_9BACL|nr:MFS transporter [Chengkuizengella sp. 2205SS18-9]MDP5276539.1 MFS transporter [Chengkuizengella sp. 2205SS18-9]